MSEKAVSSNQAKQVVADNIEKQKSSNTVKLSKMGLLIAVSVILSFIHFPILPSAPFLELEISDVPILISGFAFGPISGLVVGAISIFLHDIMVGPASGLYGSIMHVIAAFVFVLVSGLIYKHKKSRKSALIGLIAGGLSMTLVMIPANLIVTPLFLGAPRAAVQAMILPAILPFNLIKAVVDAVIVFVIYKRISPFLHR
ncbi:MAG: ECF transporter S component [Clostridiales Family XIII bacterium]|jgi:ECF transporter S component (folate family)|nr:ECF transporter S component [Clostridiales Family XIII bacterium]